MPVAAQYSLYGGHYLYWHDRYIYILTQGRFSPFSRVGIVAYTSEPVLDKEWVGFINPKN